MAIKYWAVLACAVGITAVLLSKLDGLRLDEIIRKSQEGLKPCVCSCHDALAEAEKARAVAVEEAYASDYCSGIVDTETREAVIDHARRWEATEQLYTPRPRAHQCANGSAIVSAHCTGITAIASIVAVGCCAVEGSSSVACDYGLVKPAIVPMALHFGLERTKYVHCSVVYENRGCLTVDHGRVMCLIKASEKKVSCSRNDEGAERALAHVLFDQLSAEHMSAVEQSFIDEDARISGDDKKEGHATLVVTMDAVREEVHPAPAE